MLLRFYSILLILIFISASVFSQKSNLAIKHGPGGKPYLAYKGEPLFAYGPADEGRILGGAADFDRWATWQVANGMNLIRAYPTHIPMEAWGTPCKLQPFLKTSDGKMWDVDSFNDEYFKMVGDHLARLEQYDIVVHLQLWQIVFFKSGSNRWDANYINPKNNGNDWTRSFSRGSEYINAPANSRAREHQREWVLRILDAAKGRGNVMIDVINELGNEMGTLDWAVEVVKWIRQWEKENNWQFLVGVDSEHHYRPEVFNPYKNHFDIIMLNELHNPIHARQAFDNFQKPIVSVRSSDGRNNSQKDYLFANENQASQEHQVRYRTLCYRSMFSNLQSVGCYWKMPVELADYRDMKHWSDYSKFMRAFWNRIKAHWPSLVVDDVIVKSATVTPHAYGMRSPGLHMVYLECGPHTWNNHYQPSEIELLAPEGVREIQIFHPGTGKLTKAKFSRKGNQVKVSLPGFVDDIMVLLWTKRV
jgi:hypothetical protein